MMKNRRSQHRAPIEDNVQRSRYARALCAVSERRRATAAWLVTLALAALAAFVPLPAHACGGLFCSALNLSPVDQNAERILFRVHDDGTVTAVVEISYTGEADAFSWVVPVPDTPQLGTIHPSTLQVLDQATGVRIIAPPTECDQGFRGNSNDSEQGDSGSADGGVTVTDLPRVGPFEPQVLDSDDAAALITWLNANDYLITEAMEPVVANYLGAGMKFLALKLAPDAETADIAPIVMNYPADEVMVPIVLTSVAAEPEMGVLVFIAADSRYEPMNFESLQVDRALVQLDPRSGRNNYFPLVSYLVDQSDGRAFVTQFADDTTSVSALVDSTSFFGIEDIEDANDTLDEVFAEHRYLTRMYTRISGWEMLADPSFAASPGGDVSNVIDLSDRPTINVCADDFERIPCGDTYCGPDARCGTTNSGDGCVCPEGSTAREITSPNPFGREVHCQPESFDLLQSVDRQGEGGSPCDGDPCGPNGACVVIGGFASCSCESGFAAVATFTGVPSCVSVNATFAIDQLLVPNDDDDGCGCRNTSPGVVLPWLAALGLMAIQRRARRRRVRKA